jgi:hypothetical protein
MAQAAAKRPAETEAAAPNMVKVTYTPLESGDPHTTTIAGISFRANVPVTIAADRTVAQLIRRDKETADGEVRTQSVEGKVKVIELLKGNPWFRVEGFEQPKRKAGVARTPISSADYKGYALRWIAASDSVAELEKRWEDEDGMRIQCAVSDDEAATILMFLEAQKDVLAGGGFKVAS